MKTQIRYNEADKKNQISLESETPEESMQLLALVKRTKKPNVAWGGFRDNGLFWVWVELPAKSKSWYEISRVNSEDQFQPTPTRKPDSLPSYAPTTSAKTKLPRSGKSLPSTVLRLPKRG